MDEARIMNDDIVQLSYHKKEEFVESNTNTNVVIAAFTTAYARMRLYSVLDALGEDAFYTDTDSCLYVERNGEKKVETGELLGDLKDEIPDGWTLVEYASAGSKNYAYKMRNQDGQTDYKMKIKGITQTYEADKAINYEGLKRHVQEFRQFRKNKTTKIPTCNFKRTKDMSIRTVRGEKTYRMVFDKRVVQSDGVSTLPYGY